MPPFRYICRGGFFFDPISRVSIPKRTRNTTPEPSHSQSLVHAALSMAPASALAATTARDRKIAAAEEMPEAPPFSAPSPPERKGGRRENSMIFVCMGSTCLPGALLPVLLAAACETVLAALDRRCTSPVTGFTGAPGRLRPSDDASRSGRGSGRPASSSFFPTRPSEVVSQMRLPKVPWRYRFPPFLDICYGERKSQFSA